MRRTTRTLVGAASLAACAGLVGCAGGGAGGTGRSATAGSPSGTGNGMVTAGVVDPTEGLASGTQLKTSLLRLKDLPAGFTPEADLVRDSGGTFIPPTTQSVPPNKACDVLTTNAWVQGAKIGSASFAQNGFADTHSDEIDAEIDAFRGTDAQRAMADLKRLFVACARFTTKANGTVVHVNVVVRPGPEAGDGSIRAVLTSPAWLGGTTLVAVRVGNNLITVVYSSTKKDLGARATRFATVIVGRLTAAQR